jgi:hypothetical protein
MASSSKSEPVKIAAPLWGRTLRHQGVMIGALIVAAVVLIALCAPLIAPHDP